MTVELSFDVLDIEPDRYGATPALLARLRVAETTGAVVHMVALQAQIRIDAHLRRYEPEEQDLMVEQFGEPHRWNDTVRSFTWTHAAVNLPGFSGSRETELPIQCTYDLEVLGSRYMNALQGGVVPLEFLFNGSVVTKAESGLHVHRIPWHKAAPYELPVSVLHDLMESHYPNAGWLRLHRDTLDALQRFKGGRSIPTWDRVFAELLDAADEPMPGRQP